MAREPREPTHFESRPTPLVGEFSGLLWVIEDQIKANTVITKGTTLKDFMPGIEKADALARGFGLYELTEQVAKQDGYHGFYFLKPRTPEEIAVAFQSKTVSRRAYTWPAVCLAHPPETPINRYQQPGGGSTYVERYNWAVSMKEAWDDAHDVLIEDFWSHEPFTITTAARPRPQGYVYDYVLGTFTLPPCLHGTHTYNFSTGSSNHLYPLINSPATYAATNMVDWPDEVVLVDEQKEFEGGYIRHREKALKPY